MRWNDWKVHFAVTNGNIATAVREVPGWPVIVNLRADPYEKAPHESGLYLRWYADNIWLFVPVQQKLKEFLVTLPEYPFQQGSSLNAGEHQLQLAAGAAGDEAPEGTGDPKAAEQLSLPKRREGAMVLSSRPGRRTAPGPLKRNDRSHCPGQGVRRCKQ